MPKPRKPIGQINSVAQADREIHAAHSFFRDPGKLAVALNGIAGRTQNANVLRHIMMQRDAILGVGKKAARQRQREKHCARRRMPATGASGNNFVDAVSLLIKSGDLDAARNSLKRFEAHSKNREEKKLVLFGYEKLGIEFLKKARAGKTDDVLWQQGLFCFMDAQRIATELEMPEKARQLQDRINTHGKRR